MTIEDLHEVYKENFKSAKAGRMFYDNLRATHLSKANEDDILMVVFPEDDDLCNYYGLLYLDQFLVRSLKRGALIVTCNDLVYYSAKVFARKVENTVKISRSDMDDMLNMYNLNPVKGMFFVSLSKPEGRTAYRLLNAKGITKEMLIAVGVYWIIPYRPIVHRPEYEGNNSDIAKFMSCVQ